MSNDNHASFVVIGLTVVLGVVALVGALVYLGGLRGHGDEILVETYYDKPVSGLSAGSAVNFRGVKIGEVREVSFVGSHYNASPRDCTRIYILMAIMAKTIVAHDGDSSRARQYIEGLIAHGGRATVTASGITGLSRIEINFGHDTFEPPPISWHPDNLYMPAEISLLDSFSDSATKVMNQINDMDLNAAWSNIYESVSAFSRAAEGVRVLIDSKQGEFQRVIEDLTDTAASLRDVAAEVRRNPSALLRERTYAPLPETDR